MSYDIRQIARGAIQERLWDVTDDDSNKLMPEESSGFWQPVRPPQPLNLSSFIGFLYLKVNLLNAGFSHFLCPPSPN